MMSLLMDLFPIALLAIVVYRITFFHKQQECFNSDYLSLEAGKSLKGVFALAVVFCHLAQNSEAGNLFRLSSHDGYLSVAIFFFLSGYGLQKQFINKENYKDGFLKKRLTPIVLPYVFISVAYWVMFRLIYDFTAGNILALFLIGEPIVWYSWYIVCILLFYVVFWLLMLICKRHFSLMITGSAIFCAIHILFCNMMGWGIWWYTTTHILIVGVFWATYEEKLLSAIKRKYWPICLSAILLFVALYIVKLYFVDTVALRMCVALVFVFLCACAFIKDKDWKSNPELSW